VFGLLIAAAGMQLAACGGIAIGQAPAEKDDAGPVVVVGTGSSQACTLASGSCGCWDVTLSKAPADAFEDGGLSLDECNSFCASGGIAFDGCYVLAPAAGPVVLECHEECAVEGRRPEDLTRERASGSVLGKYFASVEQLEAASIPAFRRMAHELTRHGAPKKLVRSARRAADEERRHARGARALAKRFGGVRAPFRVGACGERSLEAMAIENAVEGCVRETYAALVATWQAKNARHLDVRAHMARISHEETRHATLAWQTDAWARSKLGKDARARLDAARDEALETLLNELARSDVPAALARDAGLPSVFTAMQLVHALAANGFAELRAAA
jgi:rubrerythrin